MDADAYNARELAAGRIPVLVITALTRAWQTANDLDADGKLGPATQQAVLRVLTRAAPLPAPPARAMPLLQLHARALDIARGDLGKGEQGTNNRGPYIEQIRSVDGTGRGPSGAGAWCACFASSCLVRAASVLGLTLPIKTSRSAQALYKRVGKAGRFVEVPEPGDLICWRRTEQAGDWRGHVGIVERVTGDTVETIEGNRGPYPAVVARYRYNLRAERARKLLGFARLW
jgi:hypothetical protein